MKQMQMKEFQFSHETAWAHDRNYCAVQVCVYMDILILHRK